MATQAIISHTSLVEKKTANNINTNNENNQYL